MEQPNVFQPPSKLWMWLFTPLSIASGIWLVKYSYLFLQTDSPAMTLKWKVIAGIMLVFIFVYCISGYWDVRRVATRKNELLSLLRKRPTILYEKYNRIFLDEEIFVECGVDPRHYRRIRQRDYREVIEFDNRLRNSKE